VPEFESLKSKSLTRRGNRSEPLVSRSPTLGRRATAAPRGLDFSLLAELGASGGSGTVQRKCSACETDPRKAQGVCEGCGAQRQAIVGPADDEHEREADRVADGIAAGRRVGVRGNGGDAIRTKRPSGALNAKSPATEHLGSGAPLPASERHFFESHFADDFERVRIHSDNAAAGAAQALSARAFTLGQDIVFGAGEYRPGTQQGRSLLAHELTHVVQQRGGVSARVQRTPAAPTSTNGSVTAVADMSRETIDPVPDFIANEISGVIIGPIFIVRPHFSDPNVVHLSWMLFDPNDKVLSGGFSTSPKSPNATTEPFVINPTTFGTLTHGKHVLRLIGMNAKHEPIVFGDRDFYVLSSDQTTGTGQATGKGTMTFTQWSKTDAPAAGAAYQVQVKLAFLPDAKVACTDVAFIQAAQTLDPTGKNQLAISGAEIAARGNEIGWSIDRVDGAPAPFYIADRDPGDATKQVDNPGFGVKGSGGAAPTAATLKDGPGWNKPDNVKFESCAICRSGADKGTVYGCATWGYTANGAGKVTLMPRSVRAMPSDRFNSAIANWNKWRPTVPAATRPDEAPPLKAP